MTTVATTAASASSAARRPRPGRAPVPAISRDADERQADQPGRPARAPNQDRPERRRSRPGRRGVSQPGEAAQASDERGDPDRHVEVEDPAPGRDEESRPAGPRRRRRSRPAPSSAWIAPRIAAPANGPAAMPEERQRADDAERPRPRVRPRTGARRRPCRPGPGRRHRALDEPRRRSAGRGPGPRPASADPTMNTTSAAEEQPAGAPQVGQPAGQRHRHDVDEQIAVDDPAGLAQLDPGRAAGRVGRGRRGSTAARPP